MLSLVRRLFRRAFGPAEWIRRWQVIAFVLFLLLVGGLGAWLSIAQTSSARHGVQDDLLAICQLKVSQISAWRNERIGDVASLEGNVPLAQTIDRWLNTGGQADKDAITATLDIQATLLDYYQAALVKSDGTLLIGVQGFQSDLSPDALTALAKSCSERRPVLTDLHLLSDGSTPHVDAIAPVILDGESLPTVCVLLRAKASTYLFPLLDSWPVESRSAETLLVRADGSDVLFLNNLRALPGQALTFRLPVGDGSLPAAAAVLGRTGIMEGMDYRGVKVLAALQAVPDTSWRVVAKVDDSEALGPVWLRAGLVGGLIGLLILASLGAGLVYWQGGLKKRYAAAYAESIRNQSLLERYQYLVQQAQDAIILADSDRNILEINERALQLYGYTREEFLKLRLDDIVPPEAGEVLHERLARTRAQLQTTHEIVAMRKNGSRFPVEVSDRVFTVDGQTMIQAIIRDISERKRTEEQRLNLERQLQHTQRLESLGVLAGGIAHDFNNILTTILGHADLALHDMPLSAPGRRGVHEIVSASRRAADLCQQMLAYSGRGQFVIEDIDLRVLIDDMLNLVKSSIPKTVLLNLNLAKNLPHIRGDVSQVNQIIMNLVLNAAEAIGDRSGVITISSGAQSCTADYFKKSRVPEPLCEGLYVTLEVSDTGSGMDRQTLDQIFEPFFTTKFTGRGLGLSAVLGIVRGHKGGIVVYSEPGKGSTFKVLFPAVEPSLAEPAHTVSVEPDWRGKGTVLLADDEETIRVLGQMMLERLGFEVLLASNGREAVELFSEHSDEVAAVLLDLTMPHMNGEEAFRAIREIRPETRVVLCSGYSESEIAARFAGKGPAGFLQKPYTLGTLRRRLQEAFE